MKAAQEAVDPVTKQVETFQDSFTVGGGKSGAWYVQAVNSIQSSAQEEAILKTGAKYLVFSPLVPSKREKNVSTY